MARRRETTAIRATASASSIDPQYARPHIATFFLDGFRSGVAVIPMSIGAFGSRYGKTTADDNFARGFAMGVAVKSPKPAKTS
jgi:hypothetical protein